MNPIDQLNKVNILLYEVIEYIPTAKLRNKISQIHTQNNKLITKHIIFHSETEQATSERLDQLREENHHISLKDLNNVNM